MKHVFLIDKNLEGNISEFIKEIVIACKTLNYEYCIVLLENAYETVEFAKTCQNQDIIVYAVGDDLDINLVLNALIGGKAKLGIIPVGEDQNIYRGLDEYQSEIITANVIKVNEEYALNDFNLGFDSDLLAFLKDSKYLPYLLRTFYYTLVYQNPQIEVNENLRKRTLLAICNGTFYNFGCKLAPKAGLHSNDVYVVSASNLNAWEIYRFYKDIAIEKHLHNHKIEIYSTTKELHIAGEKSLNGLLDGRLIKGQEFNVIPHAGNIDLVNNRKLIRELRK